MLLLNVFAIALGSAAVGSVSGELGATGYSHPLTVVRLGTDLLAVVSIGFFLLAARHLRASRTAAVAQDLAPNC